MQLGYAYQKALPPSHREALFTAAEMMEDGILADLASSRGRSWEAAYSITASTLPRRYTLRYTPQFLRRFHACLLTVIWKLGQRERIPLSCVAEELAAYSLIQMATGVLEGDGEGADFGAFEDALFEDLDFAMLYDNAYDGIEETAFAEEAGLVNLAFAEWFTRFGPPDNDTYPEPHPFAWDATAPVEPGEERAGDAEDEDD